MANLNGVRIARTSQFIRWMMILPGAIGGTILAGFLLHWLIIAPLVQSSSPTFHLSSETAATAERMALPFLGAFAFVFAGTRVAPRRHMAVSITLALLLAVLMMMSLILLINSPYIVQIYPARDIIGVVLSMLGAGIAIWSTVRIYKD